MQSTENWLPVVGYEGCYEVSDHGRARSVDRFLTDGRRRAGRILAFAIRRSGHCVVTLGRGNPRQVHRMVLLAFVGPCPEGMEGCHNDGDPSNNRLSNLRWDTRSANARDRVKHGNHYQVNKTQCPRGHDLLSPNLILAQMARGYRACRACGQARTAAQHRNRPFDPAIADAKYVTIMQAG